jgi:hypothetical protein
MRALRVADLSEHGLPAPSDGPVSRFLREGRVPLIDSGPFSAAVRSGEIEIAAPLERLWRGGAILADDRRLPADTIVAATGYRADLELLVGHLGVLNAAGAPTVHGADTHPAAPGLYFAGFRDPISGHLRELRLQARQIAKRRG